MKKILAGLLSPILCLCISCSTHYDFDTIISQGLLYDGSGGKPFIADIGIKGDSIAAIGNLQGKQAKHLIDAHGLAVAPGFIDMQSWSVRSLIKDGRSLSAIKQGVTLEVFGEGDSMGPLSDTMKQQMKDQQGDIKFKVEWTTLGEYLHYLEQKGVSTNVASFLGAATIRENLLGQENRAPSPAELQKMDSLVAEGMKEGALGIGSALIYAPGNYASTDELISLCRVAAPYGGRYISHIRSEGDQLLEATDELIRISKEAHIPGIIYHLKAAGKNNWYKEDLLLQKIDSARNAGLDISACMYTYTAASTGFDAAMPPAVQEGGLDKWIERLSDSVIRRKLVQEIHSPSGTWENFYLGAGPDNILLSSFRQDSLRYLLGKRLSEVAAIRHQDPVETMIDLVISDHSRVGVVYFLMSEENVQKQIRQPWISFGSDAASMAPQDDFLHSHPHPRAYGNFARLLRKYVHDEKIIPLQEAIRKLSSWPAQQLNIRRRGSIKTGNYADIVIFDPEKVKDKATYDKPHQLSEGVLHVWVNGIQVLKNGTHTGALPGHFIKGPGWDHRVYN